MLKKENIDDNRPWLVAGRQAKANTIEFRDIQRQPGGSLGFIPSRQADNNRGEQRLVTRIREYRWWHWRSQPRHRRLGIKLCSLSASPQRADCLRGYDKSDRWAGSAASGEQDDCELTFFVFLEFWEDVNEKAAGQDLHHHNDQIGAWKPRHY